MNPRTPTLMLVSLLMLSCQTPLPPRTAPNTSPTTAASTLSAPADLQSTLAAMARSHDQKTQLAFYEALPWNTAEAPIHAFFSNMGKVQADLLKDLLAYASAQHIDLKYHAGTDTPGKGQVVMEARQEKEIRATNRADFARLALIQMYTDYEWQISLAQALLPNVHDEALKTYLQKSLKAHEEGSAQIVTLLKKYKFTP